METPAMTTPNDAVGCRDVVGAVVVGSDDAGGGGVCGGGRRLSLSLSSS